MKVGMKHVLYSKGRQGTGSRGLCIDFVLYRAVLTNKHIIIKSARRSLYRQTGLN